MPITRDLHILLVPQSQQETLRRLLELYLYELSDMTSDDLNEQGLFGYRYVDHYWTEPHRYPYFFTVHDHLAGFALVNRYNWLPKNTDAHNIAEFFVLKKYMRRGIGTAAAERIFYLHPGKWEVRVEETNLRAQAFWRKTIHHITTDDYEEDLPDPSLWEGPIFSFTIG